MAPKHPTAPPRSYTLVDGDALLLEKGVGQLLVCCECSLVHELVFEGVQRKRAVVRMHLRPRLTAAYRKRARLKFVAK